MPETTTLVGDVDPESEETLQICCVGNQGKTVSSRFGKVEFDDDGFAELTIIAKDIPLLDQLQWLLPEDRKKFLNWKAPPVEPRPVVVEDTGEVEALQAQLQEGLAINDHLSAEVDQLKEELSAAQGEIESLVDEVKSLRVAVKKKKAAAKKDKKS